MPRHVISKMAEASSSIGVEGSSSFDCSDNEGTSDKAFSLLEAPPVSELNHPRKVLANCGGKRPKTSLSTSSELSPQQRVRENPGQSLVVSREKLAC